MNTTIKIILGTILFVILAIGIAGHIKFNILQDDIYIEQEDGTVIPLQEYEENQIHQQNFKQENNRESDPKIKKMHPSWDQDGDGVNDCENDESCDHTVDYTQPKSDEKIPDNNSVIWD